MTEAATGNNKVNTKNRISKGYGIISEIISIVNEISFGSLREAMLVHVKGIITNSEVYYGLAEDEI